MTKKLRLLSFNFLAVLPLFCYAMDKETKIEDDGFSWVLVSENGFYGAESLAGKTLIPLSVKFNFIKYDSGFLIGSDVDEFEYDDNLNITKHYQGYYSKEGKCIISPGLYDTAFFNEASNGTSAYFNIMKDGRYGICDSAGTLIVNPISYSYPYYGDNGFEIKDKEGNYIETGVFLSGHDPIAMAEKIGEREADGFVWTKLKSGEQKYGALDMHQNIIFPIKFDKLEYAASNKTGSNGLFIGTIGDAEGWYAVNGFAFVPVEEGYTYIRPANYENYTIVQKKDKKYGVYEPTLSEIIPCGKYDYVAYDDNGFFRIEKDGKYGVADIFGNEIVPPRFPFLSRDEKGINYTDDNGEDVYVYIGVFPEPKERVSERFEKALKSTDNDDAIDLYRNVILADPIGRFGYISSCYNNMGVAYERKGDKATAKICYQKAVELDPDNEVANRNIRLVNMPQSQPEEKRNGWDIVADVLGAFSNAANTYNRYTYSSEYSQDDDSQSYSSNNGIGKIKHTKSNGNAFAKTVNSRIGNDTYNNYVSQLINMSVYPSRYNDYNSQRRSIQSSMKSIRERHGFNKSPWEDWDGNPDNAPR